MAAGTEGNAAQYCQVRDDGSVMPPPLPDEATLRTTKQGSVVGFRGPQGECVWLGLPYALPPIGALRWRAPQPAASWRGTRQALRAGPASAQRVPGARRYIGSEDCLYLNIWAPSSTANATARNGDCHLPVMVWIHPGGNLRGQGADFDGGVLAESQSVIVVSVNFRLGVLGWLRHAALRAGIGTEDASGNFGDLDLIGALRWIRGNIREFGGDPKNVTLFGQSAGALNIYALMTSPLAAGLFHKAILQSGLPTSMATAAAENYVDNEVSGHPQSSAELLLELLVQDGACTDRAGAQAYIASADNAKIAAYLRGKTFDELDRAGQALLRRAQKLDALAFPHTFNDGVVIPANGVEHALFSSGIYARVPLIIGCTRDEYTSLLPALRNSCLISRDASGFRIQDKQRYALVAEYVSKLMKAKSVDRAGSALAANFPGRVFTYRFDWDALQPAQWLDGFALGATHGLEIPFVFGHTRLGAECSAAALIGPEVSESFGMLSRSMMSYWAQFAHRGAPGQGRGGELPEWNACGQAGDERSRFIVFSDVGQQGIRMSANSESKTEILAQLKRDRRFGSDQERLDLWAGLVALGGFALLDAGDLASIQ